MFMKCEHILVHVTANQDGNFNPEDLSLPSASSAQNIPICLKHRFPKCRFFWERLSAFTDTATTLSLQLRKAKVLSSLPRWSHESQYQNVHDSACDRPAIICHSDVGLPTWCARTHFFRTLEVSGKALSLAYSIPKFILGLCNQSGRYCFKQILILQEKRTSSRAPILTLVVSQHKRLQMQLSHLEPL